MAISAVGTLAKISSNVATLSVSPTTLGDLMVLLTDIGSTTVHATSISGGGVATWTHVVGPFVGTSGTVSQDMWFGAVTTTGAGTVTVTGSAAITGFFNNYSCQQFTGGAGVTWAVDGTQAATKSNTASTTLTYPTLVAAGAGELYYGHCRQAAGTASTSGATAGYTVVLDAGSTPVIYNPSVSGSQSPTSVNGTSVVSNAIGALFTATSATAAPIAQPTNRARLIRASCW